MTIHRYTYKILVGKTNDKIGKFKEMKEEESCQLKTWVYLRSIISDNSRIFIFYKRSFKYCLII